ncbi:MAG: type I methionyl aminopeptidase [Candidatus Andersenbacteria bacterium]|nr:type I methionyl aminopeptidase [Candidatus Andersenbacteria bacterium]
MISLKNEVEIKLLGEGGAILAQVLEVLAKEAAVGMTGTQLDVRARELLESHGTKPSFLGYGSKGHPPFPAALCVSVNDGVVHGLPNDIPFKDGDVVKLDLGLIYKGMYLDSAHTVLVGTPSIEAKKLSDVTREALKIGIEAAQYGNTTGDIGQAVQTYVEDQGFGVVRQLVGHGVGHAVHEEPSVPNFGKAGKGVKLEIGLVIAIEPMVTAGNPAVVTASDGWTVKTGDGSLAAHEEHTVAITKDGPVILTKVG